MKKRETMFGIDLRPEAAKLRAEVEALFGRAVREEIVPGFSQQNGGATAVGGVRFDADGTPVIQASPTPDHLSLEDTVVHELHHLQLIAQGYPVFVPSPGPPAEVVYVKYLSTYLYDSILHHLFFPEMRRMGLDPCRESRSGYALIEAATGWRDTPPRLERQARALHFFKMSLESAEPEILARLRTAHRNKGWDVELLMAESMRTLVLKRAITPTSIETILATTLELLDLPRAVGIRGETRTFGSQGIEFLWGSVDQSRQSSGRHW